MRGSSSTATRRGPAECLEDGFRDMVRISAADIIYVQGYHRMVDKTLEELAQQVYVKFSHPCPGIFHVVLKSGSAGEIQYYPG